MFREPTRIYVLVVIVLPFAVAGATVVFVAAVLPRVVRVGIGRLAARI
jgi:hypothetical protein